MTETATVETASGLTLTYEIPTSSVSIDPAIVEVMAATPGTIVGPLGPVSFPPYLFEPTINFGSFSLLSTIPGITFDQNAANNTGGFYSIPPDPHAAVGLAHVVSVTNTSIEFHTKDGTQQYSDSLQDFLGTATLTFDPKVVYDHVNNRFVLVTLERVNLGGDPSDDESRIIVAVSDNANPNGTWHIHAIDSLLTISAENAWADYPGIAVDDQAIYITANMFASASNAFLGERLWIIDKGLGTGGLYDGGAASTNVYDPAGETSASNSIATTMMPAMIYGDPGGTVGTFLVSYSGISGGGQEFMQVIRVDDPLGSPSFTQQFVSLGDIEAFDNAFTDAPQLGSATLINTGDRRLQDAVWRDGSLYATTTIEGSGPDDTETTVYWAEIDTSNLASLSLAQGGTVGGEDISTDTYTYYPSIAVNANGDVGIGFAASSASMYGGSYFTYHLAGDAAGTTATPLTVQAGLDFYVRTFGGARNRWGDYSATVVDPSDDMTFWTFNEYADTRGTVFGTPSEDGRWATIYGKFTLTAGTLPFDFDGDNGDDVLYHRTNDLLLRIFNGEGGPQGGFGAKPLNGVDGIADVNGDGVQDVIILEASGALRSYSGLDNSLVGAYGNRANYTLLATRDFDGDNGMDLLLQRNDGVLQAFNGEGGFQQGFGTRALNAFQGVGDLNNDGVDDIVLMMPNASFRGFSGADGSLIANYGMAGWTLRAIDDFDGDGGDDVLFQRGDGATQAINGEGGLQQGFGLLPVGGILGSGDVNGDGASDIIVKLATNTAKSYSGDGTGVIADYGNWANWTLLALIDLDNDGGKDILYQRNTDGKVAGLNGEGGAQQDFGIAPIGGVELAGDFNADGSQDIVIRDAANFVRSYSGADGTQIASYGLLATANVLGGLPDPLQLGINGVL